MLDLYKCHSVNCEITRSENAFHAQEKQIRKANQFTLDSRETAAVHGYISYQHLRM